MAQKVIRQQEEEQTLQRFIENKGEKFNPELAIWYPQNDPRDVSYKGIDYQITHGDQKLIGEIRKKISKKKDDSRSEIFCTIRNLSNNYSEILISDALIKKKNKSSDKITLLIQCNFPGDYAPIEEREKRLKRYFAENQDSGGKWQHIFVVFFDGNIRLR